MKGTPVAASLWLIAVILLTSVAEPATALKCWRCSSDSSNGEFCADPFNELTITADQRRASYVECAQPPQQPFGKNKPQQVVCKKSQMLVNEKSAITRSCLWVDIDTPIGHCPGPDAQPSYVRIVECHTCATDGCNGQVDDIGELNVAKGAVDEVAAPAPTSAAWSMHVSSQRLVNGWMWKSGSAMSMLVMAVTFVYVWAQLLAR